MRLLERSLYWLICLLIIVTSVLLPGFGNGVAAHRTEPLEGNVLFEGRLEQLDNLSFCRQGRFVLHDCRHMLKIRVMKLSAGPNLDSLLGQYVRIKGQDVGKECVVVAAEQVTLLDDVCISPHLRSNNRHEGILQLTAEGGIELRDCHNNSTLQLIQGVNSPSLVTLLGEYVRVKGRMVDEGKKLFEVRTVIIKPNFCNQ
jgi:hypothetical protein